MKTLILASTSPRRKELIGHLGVPFEIHTEEVEEKLDNKLSPMENVECLAKLKAVAVAEKYPDHWVIGADTIVSLEGKIMGKPKDVKEAKEMLHQLSGKTHQVITGVAMICKEKGETVFHEITHVKMKDLTEEEIEQYVVTNESLTKGRDFTSISTKRPWEGKAGAYGIQDAFGAKFINGINGDYYNVVGLPVCRLYHELKKYESI